MSIPAQSGDPVRLPRLDRKSCGQWEKVQDFRDVGLVDELLQHHLKHDDPARPTLAEAERFATLVNQWGGSRISANRREAVLHALWKQAEQRRIVTRVVAAWTAGFIRGVVDSKGGPGVVLHSLYEWTLKDHRRIWSPDPERQGLARALLPCRLELLARATCSPAMVSSVGSTAEPDALQGAVSQLLDCLNKMFAAASDVAPEADEASASPLHEEDVAEHLGQICDVLGGPKSAPALLAMLEDFALSSERRVSVHGRALMLYHLGLSQDLRGKPRAQHIQALGRLNKQMHIEGPEMGLCAWAIGLHLHDDDLVEGDWHEARRHLLLNTQAPRAEIFKGLHALAEQYGLERIEEGLAAANERWPAPTAGGEQAEG